MAADQILYALVEEANGAVKLYVKAPEILSEDHAHLAAVNMVRIEKGQEPLGIYQVVLHHLNDALIADGHLPVSMDDVVWTGVPND